MRSFKTWVLMIAVFFGMSLVSGARAIAEETAAPAPTTTTTTTTSTPADKTEKTEKKHHKKPGVKKHKKHKAEAETTTAPAAAENAPAKS
jgi:hypothetical protein